MTDVIDRLFGNTMHVFVLDEIEYDYDEPCDDLRIRRVRRSQECPSYPCDGCSSQGMCYMSNS